MNKTAISIFEVEARNFIGKNFKNLCDSLNTSFPLKNYNYESIADEITYKAQQEINTRIIHWRFLRNKDEKVILLLGEDVSNVIKLELENKFIRDKLENNIQSLKTNAKHESDHSKVIAAEYISRITGQKQDNFRSLEENMRVMKDYFENIIAKMPGAVFWKNSNGIYLGCNDELAKIYGLSSREEVVGITDYEVYEPEEAAVLRKNDVEVMVSGKAITVEESAIMPDTNERKYYLSNKVPLFDETKKKTIGVLGISINITELKKAEEQLKFAKEKAEIANLAKSTFLATMSHELRTPLNGILGMVQILKEQEMTPDQKEYIAIIERSGENLLGLVNDILDLSMIESGNVNLKKTAFLFKGMIDDIIVTCTPLVSKKPIELKAKFESQIPDYILADELRLRQILLNLIGNAAKFTLKGKITLHVKAESLPNHQTKFILTVADTGIGIPDDKLEAIFERFTQVESSYNRRFEGAGLGLAIAQKLSLMMGGKITVSSKLGEGSKFTVEVILETSEVTKKVTPTQEAKVIKLKQTKSRILLVEDNPVNQKVALAFLKDSGAKVDVAASGKEAIELYEKNSYDLVLMDLSLPDGDGISVTQTLLAMKKNSGAPIIALTAHVLAEDKEKCLAAGMQEVLTKPLIKTDLLRVLSDWGKKQN